MSIRYRSAHSAARISAVDPATEQTIAHVVDGKAADVDAAVRAAHTAGAAWAATAAADRAMHLRRLADAYEARVDEMAEVVTRQNGTPGRERARGTGAMPIREVPGLSRGLGRGR